MLWIQATQPQGSSITIYTDSTIANNAAEGTSKANTNIQIAHTLRHLTLYTSELYQIDIQWVKGHSGIEGNDNADKAANKGKLGQHTDIPRHSQTQWLHLTNWIHTATPPPEETHSNDTIEQFTNNLKAAALATFPKQKQAPR
jgi:hypothetical protein